MRLSLLLFVLLATGCTNPVAPSFTCYTQPRVYISPAGVSQLEIDHYAQGTPCPAVRID